MRLVFEDCLFLNTLSEENHSIYSLKIPYYTLRIKEKEEELIMGMKKAVQDYDIFSESEAEKNRLQKELQEERLTTAFLREEIKTLRQTIDSLKDEYAKLKESSDQAYKELKQKFEDSEKKNAKLRADLRFLRSYREENENKKKTYFLLKRDKMKDVKEMHSLEEDVNVLSKLHEQLEMLENRRIDEYNFDIHQAKEVEKHKIKSDFVADAQLLTREMLLLQEKVNRLDENSMRIKRRKSDENKKKSKKLSYCLTNDLTSPMMGLDALSLRHSIEIYYSKDGKTFKMGHRSTIMPNYSPEVVEVPPNTTHMKIVHSHLHYHKTHPNVIETLKSATNFETKQILFHQHAEEDDEKHTFLKPVLKKPPAGNDHHSASPNSGNGKIWTTYKSRYSNKVLPETIARKMSLKEAREIILDTYVLYFKEYRLVNKEPKSLQELLFVTLEQVFVLQELVHKISFEFLTACDEYRTKHADILEFCKALEGLNDVAFGCSVSLALFVLRNKWNSYAKDSKTPLKKESVFEILDFMYQEVPMEERECLLNDILVADPVCLESNQYFLSKLNTFFIIAFRDVTEYWSELGESKVLVRFEKDRLQIDDFVTLMLELDPGSSKEMWKRRYRDAEAKEANSPHNSSTVALIASLTNNTLGLSSRTIGYMFAEMKWMNTFRRMKQEMESSNIDR
ncbi:hypothetical protein C9374_013494 [Naegleria lovaniensis]|uniref:Uncharacterized protein n=1 Tax=Naegleria lovaniensis TaxID=51637 RepID=A0AA88GWU4_NAELO|nr:uncharacterized protein C9374_013494 [Naegleria lovaniensis]KAG2392009.1 hypothetical protein C9374_013494 [Naegleria lovaniensis]